MAYATVEQYLLLYDTDADSARLGAYLGKASRKVDFELASRGLSVPEQPSDELAGALADVTCDMVHRVLGSGGEMPGGVTSYSQSQGGFTESFSWPASYSDLAVRADELKLLMSLLGSDTSGFGTTRFWGAA